MVRLLGDGLIPVVATIGADPSGQSYNINADTAAGAIAAALEATKLVYLTDVDGVRSDRSDPGSRLSSISTRRLRGMVDDGSVDGGMIPKVLSCVDAVESGVASAHILDGRQAHALLLEIFTREGVGTMITRERRGDPMTQDAVHDGRIMATYPPRPVTFVRGSGSLLWDEQGREYLDFLGGLAVTSLGHSHPAVARAVCEQAGTLLHVSNLFGTLPQIEVAETLDRLIDSGPGRVFFCNSGAEANEAAIKLARKWGGRGKHVVVSAYGSFHGRTLATLHATGQPTKHEMFQPLPEGFRHVAWRDLDALADDARSQRCSGASRAGPRRRGDQPGWRRVLPGGPRAVRRARAADDRGRGADRSWPHRRVVRLSALRRSARCGDGRQGTRQRRADRSVLGEGRRGRRLCAGRSRHDVWRPAFRSLRGESRAQGDGGRERPGAGS